MNKVFAFIGADHRCGTSMISLCVSEMLAMNNKDKNILLIHTEANLGDEYTPNLGESLEYIKPYIYERLVDIDDLKRRSKYCDNLSIIGGAGDLLSSSKYAPDDISYLLNALDSFDIIICDAGAEIEHGLAVGAIQYANKIYLVTEQRENAFKKIEWYKNIYSILRGGYDYLVLNKYKHDSPYTEAYCSNRFEMEASSLFRVPDSQYGDIAEIQSKSLLHYKSRAFKQGIERICDNILKNYEGI